MARLLPGYRSATNQGRTSGQGSAGGLQRRRHRHHHHHHGAGAEGAARRRLRRRLRPLLPGLPRLRAELRLRRHLLEQPPPHAPRRRSASTARILWANLHLLFWLSLMPFVTGWMGENHFGAGADRGLRRRAADGRRSPTTILQTGDHRASRASDSVLAAARRQRPQGQDLAGALPRRDRAGLREPAGFGRASTSAWR